MIHLLNRDAFILLLYSMFLRTVFIKEKKFVGDCLTMSLAKDRTFELWSTFRPKLNRINNRLSHDFISLQVYPSLDYFNSFDFTNEFIKYALVEADEFDLDDFEHVLISDTLYAVFLHKGKAENFPITMNFILSDWLPNSEFEIADAPHFEVLGKDYKKDHSESQEEIWIPIKREET